MIYLDSAATTKPFEAVVDVMSNVMRDHWGNPSSTYAFGDDARQIIEDVRSQIASDINCDPSEIIFTSGACEANSLAYTARTTKMPTYAISSKIEHKSLHEINKEYAKLIDNDNLGNISLASMYNYLTQPYNAGKSWFVTLQAANGEIGVIQNIKELSEWAHDFDVIFHTDATQLFAEKQLDVKALGVDMMSVSAQKFNGPRGVGFLYVKNGIKLQPIISGSQENGIRGGTYNTAAIAGMGEALRITREMQNNGSCTHICKLRNHMLEKLLQINGVKLNGPNVDSNRLVNNINISIDGVSADRLTTMCSLYGIYISKGSACQSYEPTPSHVLKAIGLSDNGALSSIRITLGHENTEQEVEQATKIITKLVERIRDEK